MDIHGFRISRPEDSTRAGRFQRYNGKGVQYTERQMWRKVIKLWPRLKFGNRIDIIYLAPAFGLNDEKAAHRGFKSFRYLIDTLSPRYFIHRLNFIHAMHNRIINIKIQILNAYEYYVLEI